MPWRRASVGSMAAPLSLTSATITTPDGVHEKAAIHIRTGGDTVRVTRGTTVLAHRDGVTKVERINKRRVTDYVVTFADGTVWEVSPTKGGCKPCGR